MKVLLSNFETVIERVIVQRGEEYFRSNAVRGLKKLKDGEWIASVEGTEVYTVHVLLKGNTVQRHSCSCPYDLGPVCKHVVAVLFALRTSAKSTPTQETFEETIARMPREDLNAALTAYAGEEPGFVDFVLARRVISAPTAGKEAYRRVIQNAVDAARGRDGFIGYWEASRAVRGAGIALDAAQGFLEEQQPARALPIYQCVLEEMVSLLQEADDSNGAIGDAIGQAFQGLSECGRQASNTGFRKGLLGYLLKECGQKRYEGWSDWRWEFLAIAANVVQTSQERDELFCRIEEIERKHGQKDDWPRYEHERAVVIKMAVIERLGSKDDVENFLNQHLDCTPLRERAIEQALKRKDHNSAKQLAMDGLVQDQARGLPGLINLWTEHLLDIAEAQKDWPSVKEYALQLFLEKNDFVFYDRYKRCFTTAEWRQQSQKIIDLIRRGKDGRNYALALPEIYIREQRWPDLMDFVKESNSPWALEQFTKHLTNWFPDRLADVYEKVIVEKLAPPMGRGQYQYLCQFLRRLQKFDHKDRTRQLVAELSEKYRNRPAMLEELSRI